jgi:hypothetical protein
MSVSFRKFYVARPSIAPTSSTTGGTYFVAHRRVNQLSQRTEISPIRTGVALPATLTPQTYSDTFSLLRDEFLVSEDGSNWKIVPSVSDHVGALLIPAFSSGWATTTISSNQASTGFDLNFGDFSPSSEPEQIFYLLNIGSSINSLTFNFLDLVTNSIANTYSGLIEVSILGTYQALGNNPDNSFNQSLIWSTNSLNTVSLLLPNLSFLKLKVKLLNFPLGLLESQQFVLSLSVTSNLSSFALTYPNQWPSGSFLIDDDTPFRLPIIEANGALSVKINPFQFNDNGILRSNLIVREFPIVVGSYKVVFVSTGSVKIEATSYVLATNETNIGTFTLNVSAPFVTNVVYPWPIKPQSYLQLGETSTLEPFRFATFVTDLAYASGAGQEMGVTMYENSNLIATSGLTFIELLDNATQGQRLASGANGLATPGNGPLVALESGLAGQTIKAGFVTFNAEINSTDFLNKLLVEVPKTANHTLVASDMAKGVTFNSASDLVLTLETNAVQPIPIGAQVLIGRKGTGLVSIDPATGVNINGSNATRQITAQRDVVTLWKTDTNEWWAIGSLS